MIKIDSQLFYNNTNINLEFELSIESSSSVEISAIYFNIDTNNNIIIRIPCIKNNKDILVTFPENIINTLLKTNVTYNFFIEVLCGTQLFRPLEDTIIFTAPPKMVITPVQKQSTVESTTNTFDVKLKESIVTPRQQQTISDTTKPIIQEKKIKSSESIKKSRFNDFMNF